MPITKSAAEPRSSDRSPDPPPRKSRLRRQAAAARTRRGSQPVAILPRHKNWLLVWGAGLFCLATVTLLPIYLLESSVFLQDATGSSTTSSHHGVHRLMDVAQDLRHSADRLIQHPQQGLPVAEKKSPKEGTVTASVVAKADGKVHYELADLPLDATNWQAKAVARGVAGVPLDQTPAVHEAKRASIQCDLPVDSLAYWNVPTGERDVHYESPYQQLATKTQYITFTPDNGGWNNVRMSMEIIFVLAAVTGRTLVMPPKVPLYLLHHGKGDRHRGFADFFPVEELPIPIISFKEFLEREAGVGFPLPKDELVQEAVWTAAEVCDKRANAKAPCSAVDDFLEQIGHNPGVSAKETCLVFDQAAIVGKPSEEALALVAEKCGKRKAVFWNQTMATPDILYFPAHKKDYRLLTHFYNMIYFSDPAESHHFKRFVRDYLHYHDSIYCAAGKIVQALQLEGKSRGFEVDDEGGGGFSALHVRRGDLQYKRVKIPASEWYENTKEIWQDKEILYVATDERNKTFFDDLAVHYDLRYLDDYWDMAGLGDLDPNYMGMIDTIVASRGRAFCGTFFSTFTGYINRLRGYHGMTMMDSWYSFLPKKTHMHEWTKVDHTAFSFEWPDGWVGIDADTSPNKDKF